MQVFGHHREAGSDDAADVIARAIDNVKRDGRAEIDDHGGAPSDAARPCVREAVRSDGLRFGIIDADPSQCPRVNSITLQPVVTKLRQRRVAEARRRERRK